MLRWVMRFLVVASIVLGVVAAGLWARSYREAQSVVFGRGRFGITQVTFVRGTAMVTWTQGTLPPGSRPPGVQWVGYRPGTWDTYQKDVTAGATRQWRRWGFASLGGQFPRTLPGAAQPFWQVEFPLWPVLVLAGVLPVVSTIASIRRHRRRKSGACQQCGYDLRGGHERCPECGAEVPNVDSPEAVAAAAFRRRRARVRLTLALATWAAVVAVVFAYARRPLNTGRRADWFDGTWDLTLEPGPAPGPAPGVANPEIDSLNSMGLRVRLKAVDRLAESQSLPAPYVGILTLDARGPAGDGGILHMRLQDPPAYGFALDGDLLVEGGNGTARFWRDGDDLVIDANDTLMRLRRAPTTEPTTQR